MAYQAHIPNITLSKGGASGAAGSAFGGWIYNFSYELGNSQTPGSISLDIALDSQTNGSNPDFAISHVDLDASSAGKWQIDFGGKVFEEMYLVSYDIKGDGDSKSLKVVFKDFGMVLDKIHVALFKRHDYHVELAKTLAANVTVAAYCPDCSVSAGLFSQSATVYREIDTANYFYKNGSYKDNFRAPLSCLTTIVNTPMMRPAPNTAGLGGFWPQQVLNTGTSLYTLNQITVTMPACGASLPEKIFTFKGRHIPISIPAKRTELASDYFTNPLIGPMQLGGMDIDGGTIVLGTEEFNEKQCSNLPNVSYSFLELIVGIVNSGLKVRYRTSGNALSALISTYSQAYHNEIVKNINYFNNYHGTLREVLNNWCSDFGIDFYVDNDTLVFYNMNKTKADFTLLQFDKIPVPTSTQGTSFNSNTDTAITNYGESCTVEDNYLSALVVSDLRPRNISTESKVVARGATFTSLHPLDFLYGVGNANYNSTTHWWDGRILGFISNCAAIGRYNGNLRDIFAAIEISQDPTTASRQSYNSFAFTPYVFLNEATDSALKQQLLEKFFNSKGSDNVQNYFNNSNYFEIIVGIRAEEQAEEILEWERLIADNMYKYGLLTNGNIDTYPYLSEDFTQGPLNNAGLYDTNGLKILKVKNDTTPPSQRYADASEFPLKELLKTANESHYYFGLRQAYAAGFIADLGNEWGTEVDEFNRNMTIHSQGNCNNFSQGNTLLGSSTQLQSFQLSDFKPSFNDLSADIIDELEGPLKTVMANNPSSFNLLQGLLLKRNPTKGISIICPKLQVMIVPKGNHPNCRVVFGFGGAVNRKMQDKVAKYQQDFVKEKNKQFPKTVCDIDLQKSVCDTLCVDPSFYDNLNFNVGFTNFNARAITVSVTSNPTANSLAGGSNDFKLDGLGRLQVKNANEDFPLFTTTTKTQTIIYPVNGPYQGLITQNVEVQTRSPEVIKIKNKLWGGTPKNVTKIAFINEEILQDVKNLILDPSMNGQLIKPVFDRLGNQLKTMDDYFLLIESLQREAEKTDQTISCTVEVAGNILTILGAGHVLLDQSRGFLKSLSLTMTQNGFISKITVSSAGKKVPKKEAFINYRSSRAR